jgi:glycosyltransferase involved in cell wall biosynthesis
MTRKKKFVAKRNPVTTASQTSASKTNTTANVVTSTGGSKGRTSYRCLNMIVKNEEKCILSCLESYRPLIHLVAILDTGSTDRTMDIINGFMKKYKIPGEVYQRPWFQFGRSRTEALRYCENVVCRHLQGKIVPANIPPVEELTRMFEDNILKKRYPESFGYLEELTKCKDRWAAIFSDADDVIKLEPSFDMQAFEEYLRNTDGVHYGYHTKIKLGGNPYDRCWMAVLDIEKSWKYKHPRHECMYERRLPPPKLIEDSEIASSALKPVLRGFGDAEKKDDSHAGVNEKLKGPRWVCNWGVVSGTTIIASTKGARNLDPEKYKHDGEEIEKHIHEKSLKGKFCPRMAFYCAKSYNDAGMMEKAKEWYIKRVEGPSDSIDDLYMSYNWLGDNEEDEAKKIGWWNKAYDLVPFRREAASSLVEYYRKKNMFHIGGVLGLGCLNAVAFREEQFRVMYCYEFKIYDETSVCLANSGRWEEAIPLMKIALKSKLSSKRCRDRIHKNSNYCHEKLEEKREREDRDKK